MKRTAIAAVISLIVNLGGMIVNYLHFQKTNYLLFSVKSYGGEYMGESGFGLWVSHIYPMTADAGKATHSLHFSPVSFILSVLVIWAAVYVITLIAEALRNRITV